MRKAFWAVLSVPWWRVAGQKQRKVTCLRALHLIQPWREYFGCMPRLRPDTFYCKGSLSAECFLRWHAGTLKLSTTVEQCPGAAFFYFFFLPLMVTSRPTGRTVANLSRYRLEKECVNPAIIALGKFVRMFFFSLYLQSHVNNEPAFTMSQHFK